MSEQENRAKPEDQQFIYFNFKLKKKKPYKYQVVAISQNIFNI